MSVSVSAYTDTGDPLMSGQRTIGEHRAQGPCHGRCSEAVMADEEGWLARVRRWCRHGDGDGRSGPAADADERDALGYEAAVPALQARHWPDAATIERPED